MKRWKIQTQPSMMATHFVTKVIAGIGTPHLARFFLEAMQTELPATYCTVFGLGGDGRVSAISTASSYGQVATITAAEYSRLGFDRQDSNMKWLAKRKTRAGPQMWLSHQRAEDVSDVRYRQVCYVEPGISERTSILLLQEDGLRLAVSFYRSWSFPPFDEAQFSLIETYAPVLIEAAVAHIRATAQESAGSALRQRILSGLPNRERQVVTHILSGYSTKETAELLDLSPNTVLTYRYRAFGRLGVRTQRDLLALIESLPLVS